jgi:hypothetical protein
MSSKNLQYGSNMSIQKVDSMTISPKQCQCVKYVHVGGINSKVRDKISLWMSPES